MVSDPTPWHAVLTSPVAAVLHTTPPHPLQQADRTCPQWDKTPSHVVYTPEAVFGRSPTPLSEGVSKTPGRGNPGLPVSSNSTLSPFPVFAGCGCSPLHGVASPPGSGPRAGTSPLRALRRIGDVAVLGVLLQHPLPGATKRGQGETLQHLLLIEKKVVSSHYFPLHVMYEIPNSPCTRRGRIRRKQPIEVLKDSSWEQLAELTQSSFSIRFKVRGGSRGRGPGGVPSGSHVSIRFKVRGGFRPEKQVSYGSLVVSIRFKVRGGFRRQLEPTPSGCKQSFQSALRFAVVSDSKAYSQPSSKAL